MSEQDDILQDCLDELASRQAATIAECLQRHSDAGEDIERMLAVAQRFQAAPAVRPSAAFREVARARMINLVSNGARSANLAPATVSRTLWWRRMLPTGFLLRGSIAMLAVVLFGGGTAIAALGAPPDSPLYSAKLALEEARVMLAANDTDRVELHLAMAQRRVLELSTIAGKDTPGDVDRVATCYEEAVKAAVREVTAQGTPLSAVVNTEARLAVQQETMQQIMAKLGDGSPEQRASLGRALGTLERQRTELRNRLEGGPAVAATPTQSQNQERERDRERNMTGTAIAQPSLTPNPAMTPGGAIHRWGQTPTVTPVQAGETPTASPETADHQPSVTPQRGYGEPTYTQTCTPARERDGQTATPLHGGTPGTAPTATPHQEQNRQQGPLPTSTPSPAPLDINPAVSPSPTELVQNGPQPPTGSGQSAPQQTPTAGQGGSQPPAGDGQGGMPTQSPASPSSGGRR
jgi:hypothetical protein